MFEKMGVLSYLLSSARVCLQRNKSNIWVESQMSKYPHPRPSNQTLCPSRLLTPLFLSYLYRGNKGRNQGQMDTDRLSRMESEHTTPGTDTGSL